MVTPNAFLLNQSDLSDGYGMIIGQRAGGVRGNVLVRGVTSITESMMAILTCESRDVTIETLCVFSDPGGVLLRIKVRHGEESSKALQGLIGRLNEVLADPSRLDESNFGPLPGAMGEEHVEMPPITWGV